MREEFGTRWLSTDYRLGDVMIFNTRNVHATLDNRSEGFRLTIDVRFQPANDPVDPRFEGPNPVAHGARGTNIFKHSKQVTDGVRRHLGRQLGPAAVQPASAKSARVFAALTVKISLAVPSSRPYCRHPVRA